MGARDRREVRPGRRRRAGRVRAVAATLLGTSAGLSALLGLPGLLGFPGSPDVLGSSLAGAASARPVVSAVGAENQYADVIAQIGGPYVRVQAIERNPDIDPHTFEASAGVARTVGSASLVVQNGLGYDTFMNRIESATPNPHRRVVVVRRLLGLPDSTPNPHLWYLPATMPKVASAVAADLSALLPGERGYFRVRLRRFVASLGQWHRDLAALRKAHDGDPVAVTEPVGDYLLQAAGLDIATPFGLQADVMNGVDPAPEAVSLENRLLTAHKVKALLYNQQVVDPLTQSFLHLAEKSGIPVVGLYETMPAGYHYQRWMVAETQAIERALTDHRSTVHL